MRARKTSSGDGSRGGVAARALLAAGRLVMVSVLLFAAAGCSNSRQALTPPQEVIAPYDSSLGAPIWAVAPLRNESGTGTVDALAMTDRVISAAAQVRGIQVLPLNRTLEAMRSLDIREILTLSDLQRLAEAMNVDAVLAGAITAWDPYTPTIGLTLALHLREGRLQSPARQRIDPISLQMRPTDGYTVSGRIDFEEGPASVAAQHLDGKNQGVQMRVEAYARGRSEPDTALGWRRYIASMDLFSEFGAYDTVSALIDREWQRVSRAEARGMSRR